jgi:hypothetical protein
MLQLMMASCMRYCNFGRRVTSGPYSATSRSIKLVLKLSWGQLAVIAGQDQMLGHTALCCLVQDLPGHLDPSDLFAADPAGIAEKV